MARYSGLDPQKYIRIRDAAIALFYERGEAKVTIEQIARWAGLTRRNGRIDDNQAFHMMQLAQCPVSKTRKYGMRCWDAREAMQALARWTGSWAWVVD